MMENKKEELTKSSSSTASSASASSPNRGRNKSLKGKPLESVSECDELVSASPTSKESCMGFGVKSYLHKFYEHVSVKDPQIYEEYEEYRYLIAPKGKRRNLFIWRFTFWTGFILLLFGAIVLSAGYLVPRMNIDVGYQEEMRIIDRAAFMFNQNLEWCKIIGLAVFCVGGTLLSASLLLPSLIGLSCIEDDANEDSAPFKLRIVDEDSDAEDETNKLKIPVTEELKSVQPKREDEMIVTHSGLTKRE